MGKYCGSVDVDTTLREVGAYCESGFRGTHEYASFCFLRKLEKSYYILPEILDFFRRDLE